MTKYTVRFNLSPAGSGSMQNPARCVAVEAAHPAAALTILYSHYSGKGRNPRAYAIEVDGVWHKIETREFSDFSPFANDGRHYPDMGGQIPEILGAIIHHPKPMPVETPEWAYDACN